MSRSLPIPTPSSNLRREASETVARRCGLNFAVACLICIAALAFLHQQITDNLLGMHKTTTIAPEFVVPHRPKSVRKMKLHEQQPRRQQQLQQPLLSPTTPLKVAPSRTKKLPPPPIKVPLPVFVLSLPKSGTTSTHKYFQCGRQKSVHWGIQNDTKHVTTIGQCWGNNYRNNRPMLDGCANDKFQVYSDIGYVYQTKQRANNTRNGHLNCFYPSVHGLDNIATHYPNSTVLLVTRNDKAWANRVNHWYGIHQRWQLECDGFPPGNAGDKVKPTIDDWADFYNNHTTNIRHFAKQHPSIRYIEIELESDQSGEILENAIGISKYCWGDCPPTQMSKCTAKLQALRDEAALDTASTTI